MAISAVDLQAEINALRSMEANLNKVHAARQKYMSQHNENKLVLAELKMLKEGATVFKMSTFPPTCGIPPPPDPAAPAAARAAICAARARGDSACFLCMGGGEGRAGEGAEESRPSRPSPSLLLSISVLLLSLSPSSFAIASHRPSFLSANNGPPLCPPPRALLSSRLPYAVGPALVKQDQDEAVANVSKRLEWIESELDKVGSKEKEITKGLETQSRKVQKMQAEAQAAATAPAE